jgi:hypothetical protein
MLAWDRQKSGGLNRLLWSQPFPIQKWISNANTDIKKTCTNFNSLPLKMTTHYHKNQWLHKLGQYMTVHQAVFQLYSRQLDNKLAGSMNSCSWPTYLNWINLFKVTDMESFLYFEEFEETLKLKDMAYGCSLIYKGNNSKFLVQYRQPLKK